MATQLHQAEQQDGARQHSGNSTALTWDALQPLGHGRRAYSDEHSDAPDDDGHPKASDNAAAGIRLGSSAAAHNSGSIVGNHKVADCMLEMEKTCSKHQGCRYQWQATLENGCSQGPIWSLLWCQRTAVTW